MIVLIASLTVGILLALAFGWWLQKNPQVGKMSDSDLALALLSEKQIGEASERSGRVRSQLVEFNDHMEPEAAGAPYKSFVGRLTIDRISLAPFLSNSVMLFAEKPDPINFMNVKSQGNDSLSLSKKYGDGSVAYFSPASDFDPAHVTIRLYDGLVGSKVQVFDTAGNIQNSNQAAEELLPIAEKLAAEQETNLETSIFGTRRFSQITLNDAMQQLPETINGATLIGMSEVKDTEWLAITGDFQTEKMKGFVSGGLVRFRLDARPDEAVEVTVLEFDSPETAADHHSTFLTQGVAVDPQAGAQQFELPDDLASAGKGLIQPTLAEIQSPQGAFLVDVSVLSPFQEIDKDAAIEDVIAISRSFLSGFAQ